MHFRFTGRYLLSLAALTSLLVELHEQRHAIAARQMCGGWAGCTFDNVLTYRNYIASGLSVVDLVGPRLSYAVLWAGAPLLRAGRR